jgi:radical SAM superfamily enzyme YgiQ (UPF0313 family)
MKLSDRTILLVAPEIINPRSMPCVGLGYIGAYLSQVGRLNVRIIDAQYTKENPLPAIANARPTLVAIGVDSRTILRGLRIARFAKAHGHTTVLGGLHVSLIKHRVLEHREVDFGIVGDGEVPMLQLVEALEGRRSLNNVSGLIYRGSEGTPCSVPNTTEVMDLDSLPFPDYRLAGINQFRLYPLVTSRDCPYKCTYCTVGTISHGRFRGRSPSSCVEEILLAKDRYGISGVVIVDENFAFEPDRASEFAQRMIDSRVNLPWTAFEGMRADTLVRNPRILDLLKRSQCRWIFFGIESAEDAVLKRVLKGQKFHVIDEAARLVRASGMKVGGFFIVGLPDSTFNRDLLAIDWATRRLDGATFWMSIPYYGTGLYRWVKEHGRLLREPIGHNLINSLSTMPFYDTPSYPAREIKRAHVIGNLRTGAAYHLDYMDREASQHMERTRPRRSDPKRRLIETVTRYDPSWLPNLVGPAARELVDPVRAAVEAARNSQEEPLPPDVLLAAKAARKYLPVIEAP